MGVRVFPGAPASRDLEPEYIAIDPADGAILVTLQEANTVARIDRATLEITLLPQGTVNHAELGNGIDASDRDGAIRIANWPVQGLRMADALATFQIGDKTYYATANEGDGRNFDESRVKDLALDPTAFPLAEALKLDGNLGRLTVSNINGDVDGDGDFDQLFSFGSRSFTIYDADGAVVFDSGDDFERIIADLAPDRFNSDKPSGKENRSDNKGPEPEAVAVGEVDGRMIAVIGLERDSGLVVYDVTDPANARYLTYIDGVAAGDVSPEVIAFIPGDKSPSGFAQIAVAYEVSGSTAVYDLTFTGEPVSDGEPDTDGEPGYDLQITEMWPGNDPGENLTADWIEITNFGDEAWVEGADPALYYDDESADPAAADPIAGIASIAPGESVIVMIDAATAAATFRDAWSTAIDLDDVKIGYADGAGLGKGGDGAALFVGGPDVTTLADFETFPDTGENGGRSWNVIAGAFSAAGDAFGSVTTDVVNDEGQPAIGSPGFAIEADSAATFTLHLLHGSDFEASADAVFDAPRFSAVMNALAARDVGADATLRLASGDAILPGLFFAASDEVFGAPAVADMLIHNALGWDAISFGNHEFDLGPALVADLIDGTFDTDGDPATAETALDYSFDGVSAYQGAAFPYLSVNLDFSTEPDLAPLAVFGGQAPLAGTVTSSVVVEKGGERIALIGATTPSLASISSPGAIGVSPEDYDGDPTPAQLDALAAIIQAEVYALLAFDPSINKVIVQAHMQQIAIEQALAARLVDVDIIIAGGSNTRLLDETDRLRDGDDAQGVYPIVVKNAGGTDTLVVNTDGSYKYVGSLVIDFDADGNIIAESYDAAVSGAYATDEQGVADLGAAALTDPEVQAVADLIGAQIVRTEGNVLGVSDVYLAGLRDDVRQQETNLGNLTADANLAEAKKTDATVLVSIKNGGGIRDDIGREVVVVGTEVERLPNEEIRDADGAVVKPAGGISQNDIGGALRFNNDLSLLTLTGAELRAVLEHGVAASTYDENGGTNSQGRFPQVAGVAFSFDPDLPAGARIVNAAVLNEDGSVAVELVRDGATVSPDATIRIVTLGFLANGGDGYPFPTGDAASRIDLQQEGVQTGLATFADNGTEQDALAEYLAASFLDAPFAEADTPFSEDTRIQNLNFRADAVFGEVTTASVVINEVLGSTTGADSEYVELFGEAGFSLAGLSLIVVESNDQPSRGTIDFRFDFADDAALGANGFYLLANARAEATYGVTADARIADNAIENSSYTLALVETDSLAGSTFSGAEVVLDAVGVFDGDGAAFSVAAAPVVGPDGAFLPAGVGRIADGVDTDTAADWTILSFSNDPTVNTPTSGVETGGGGGEITLISAIQGAGDATPLAGARVTVEAVVTLVSNQLNGFFLQEQDGDADGDAATSEGVFVFTGADPTVSVGDVVRLEGAVGEFSGMTQLSGVSGLTVLESGAALPAAVAVTLPLPDAQSPAAFYESIEGMRVGVTAADGERLSVTDAFTRFGEVGVTSGAPLTQPTQAFASFSPEAEALAEANARDVLLFENAEDDSLSSAPRVGDGVVGDRIDGVMAFSFGDYKVETQGAVAFDATVNPAPRHDAPDDVGGRLQVASFNVLNYFTTLGERGAATAQELADQTAKIVAAITAIDADILGLIEIENDLGGVNDEAVAALTGALNAALGAEVYAYVATGKVGDDAIRQALLYKPEIVAPKGTFAVLDDEAFTAPYTPGDPKSRPALAQSFEEIATGEVVTVSVNHLKSKGSPTGAIVDGEADDSPVEGSAALTRVAAMQKLAAWIASDPTGSGDADHLTIGDFNAYAMERSIKALEAEGFTNLADADAISYYFGGRGGTLDYAFANEALLGQVTGATIWNVNSPEAYSVQYDGDDFAAFGDLSAFASSDHDPVIVGLDLGLEALTLTASLFDAATEAFIARIENGGVIDHDLVAGRDLTIVAEAVGEAGSIGSVALDLNGDFQKVENFAPYALFGDTRRGTDLKGGDLAFGPGDNVLTLEAFSDRAGGGDALGAASFNFRVQDAPDTPIALSLFDADANTFISRIADGDTIDFSLVEGRSLTMVAAATAGGALEGKVGSMAMDLDDGAVTALESFEPYALFGDNGRDFGDNLGIDLKGGITLASGAHRIEIDVFDGDFGRGAALGDFSFDFALA